MAPPSGREREIKLELASDRERERLLGALPAPIEVKDQFNHYFDLPGGELRAAGVMLRLRIESSIGAEASPTKERARITVKEGAKRDGAGLFDSAEREADLPLELARAVVAGETPFAEVPGSIVATLAARFGDLSTLAEWGTLTNRRSVHTVDEGFVVEVDQAVYPDGTVLDEVELESEDPEAARRWLLAFLAGIPVEARPSTASKSERLARARGKD